MLCLNPDCPNPENPDRNKFCQNCGSPLLLGDKYRALKRIGSGNYSRTFIGVAEQDTGKNRCIIKQFRHQSKKAARSFQQELDKLSELGEHPQIPLLLAAFQRNERQYLVQEFIEGENLAAELAETGAFNEEKISQILESLLPVLHLIHSYGLIHRDVKPENIIRCRENQRLVLGDFGVAKQATATAMLTPGTMVGSAEYTAPEQLMGQPVFASDIYSLGVTCIHLLTDMTPFDLFDSLEGVWIWRDYLSIGISDALGDVLDKMLLPLKQRYRSAKEVLTDLNPTLSRHLISKLPKSVQVSQQTLEKFTTTHKISSKKVSASPRTKISREKPTQKPPNLVVQVSPPTPKWHCVQTLKDENSSPTTATEITSIAFSAQSRTLIAGSWDGTMKLWDFTNGELLHTLTEQTGGSHGVVSLAVSPNGQTLARGNADGTIDIWRLWQLGTAELHQGVEPRQRFKLTGHTSVVASLDITADGLTLASGSRDRTIKLWNLQTGELQQTLTGHQKRVISVVFSSDRQFLASGSEDCTIKLWPLNDGSEIGELTGHLGAVYAVAISPDSRTLVSSSWDRTIKIWDLSSRQELKSLTGHGLPCTAVAISRNGKTLATGSHDTTIKLWDLATGELAATLTEHTKAVNSVIFSPDGNTLASGSSDRTVKLWRFRSS